MMYSTSQPVSDSKKIKLNFRISYFTNVLHGNPSYFTLSCGGDEFDDAET